jgi:hypothetical protein
MLDKNSQVQHCWVNNCDIRHEKYVEVVNEIKQNISLILVLLKGTIMSKNNYW